MTSKAYQLDSFHKHELTNYEVFLPDITASIREKGKFDNNLTDNEFRSVVATSFKRAMIQFCKDSHLYTADIPIDFYVGTRRYDIVPPKGFSVVAIKEVLDGAFKAPKNYNFDLGSIYLGNNVCVREDTHKAIWVRIALKPSRLNTDCRFHADFIDRYYEEILDLMFHHLHMMDRRRWADLGRADRYNASYKKKLREARKDNSPHRVIKRGGYSLTDARHSFNK